MAQEGLQLLTLNSLEELDPVIFLEWQKSLQAAVRDCADRPHEEKPREIALIVKVTPVRDIDGANMACVGVEAELTVKSTRPAHTRGGKSMSIYADGQCAFNPLSPHNVQQRTLPISGAVNEDSDYPA